MVEKVATKVDSVTTSVLVVYCVSKKVSLTVDVVVARTIEVDVSVAY